MNFSFSLPPAPWSTEPVAVLEKRNPPEGGIEEASRRLDLLLRGVTGCLLDFNIEIVRKRHLDGLVEAELALDDADTRACGSLERRVVTGGGGTRDGGLWGDCGGAQAEAYATQKKQ